MTKGITDRLAGRGQKIRYVTTRRRDLVIRIADWTRDKDEPAYDVEVYVRGVCDLELSNSFCLRFPSRRTKAEARAFAVAFAQEAIEKHLK